MDGRCDLLGNGRVLELEEFGILPKSQCES